MKALAFIRAIERFTCRRETPIINDMFKTFKSSVVKKFMLCSGVRLKFISPATAILLKKRLWHRCFPVNFAKFLRTPFFIEHLWWLLLTGLTFMGWVLRAISEISKNVIKKDSLKIIVMLCMKT